MSTPQRQELPTVELREVPYDGPLAAALVAEVQQEYVVRYGGPDATPVDPAQFAPPHGAFLVLLVEGEPVGTAGLRVLADGDVELKRMYVRATHRRRGHARTLLRAVEDRARALGHRRVVLETGDLQPEAVALYRSAGYLPVPAFGHYADSVHSVHLGRSIAPGTAPAAAAPGAPSPPTREAGPPPG